MEPGVASSEDVALFSCHATPLITLGCMFRIAGPQLRPMFSRTLQPRLLAKPTELNTSLLDRCPSLYAPYHLPLPLCNGHVETVFAAQFRTAPGVVYERELLHLPDGGVVALDRRIPPTGEQPLVDSAPIVIFLPGLTGGSKDSYVQHAVHSAAANGFRPIVMNMRGTGDVPVRSPQFFSAAYTGDLREVIAHVGSKYPESLLLAAGWSNGGSILANYLGEEGAEAPLTAAVILCCPFNLPQCSKHLSSGIDQLYSFHLGTGLRTIFLRHRTIFEEEANRPNGVPYRTEAAAHAQTIREFDDAITCLTFGYKSADEYYAAASSDQRVSSIAVPTLIIQAEDDPIALSSSIPRQQLEKNPHTVLALTPTGGHLGWCNTEQGVRGAPWANTPMMEWFKAVVELHPLTSLEQCDRMKLHPGHGYSLKSETSVEQVQGSEEEGTGKSSERMQ